MGGRGRESHGPRGAGAALCCACQLAPFTFALAWLLLGHLFDVESQFCSLEESEEDVVCRRLAAATLRLAELASAAGCREARRGLLDLPCK